MSASPLGLSSSPVPPAAIAAAIPVLDQLQEWMGILDGERRFVWANAALVQALRVDTAAALAGLRLGDAVGCLRARTHPGGCGSTPYCGTCGAHRATTAAQSGRDGEEECRILLDQGGGAEIRVRARPWQAPGERFILLSLRDTSAEHRRRALERIFFHDLRNTAGGIAGFSEFLAEDLSAAGSTEEVEMAGTVVRLSRQLLDEIDAQHQLTAAEQGDLQPRREVVVVGSLLDMVRALYARHEVAAGKQIEVIAPAESLRLMTDPALCGRVVGNLTKNALEACPPGGKVRLGATEAGGHVMLSVRNPGWIPEDIQRQIFQRSFSTKGPGRGLGTYSVQLITEKYLGGAVGFTSSPEHGTEFWVKLPAGC